MPGTDSGDAGKAMIDGVDVQGDTHSEDHVDDQIEACLNLDAPTSFFLFAGAGSGKTRSLVAALRRLRARFGQRMKIHGQRIGVITYTNAACDEITSRLEYDPLVAVSTIHSFVWSLIGSFHSDIKQWLQVHLADEIAELEALQRKGRPGTKAQREREESIKSKRRRLEVLPQIRRFSYNPAGDNHGRDSLSHTEVIKIGADFVTSKPLMQRLLISRFPVLLVDESQDTNKLLMEALLKLQHAHRARFCLGLFGDTMQRIYADGKEDLGRDLPADWARPAKELNHRCPQRIVRLLNQIRSAVDKQEQRPRSDSREGVVRLFVLPGETADKMYAERRVKEEMVRETGDPLWSGPGADVKTLILEHHMAARRMGFLDMFQPLYEIDSLQTGLRDGSLPGIRLFSEFVSPLLKAKARGDEFVAAAIVRKASPLLSKAALIAAGPDQRQQIRKARDAVNELAALWSGNCNPRFLDVLRCICRSGLFEVPECLEPFAAGNESEQDQAGISDGVNAEKNTADEQDGVLSAWQRFLLTPFVQIESYDAYVRGQAPFETHQGVKGREFPRVMVVMDDAEARGFMFSYEKLFGAKEKTKNDLENERGRKETGIDRTRRLFYVTCSRAQKSLAIVAYSSHPEKVGEYVLKEGWFESTEVRVLA